MKINTLIRAWRADSNSMFESSTLQDKNERRKKW